MGFPHSQKMLRVCMHLWRDRTETCIEKRAVLQSLCSLRLRSVKGWFKHHGDAEDTEEFGGQVRAFGCGHGLSGSSIPSA
jgi:hypothetical protein